LFDNFKILTYKKFIIYLLALSIFKLDWFRKVRIKYQNHLFVSIVLVSLIQLV